MKAFGNPMRHHRTIIETTMAIIVKSNDNRLPIDVTIGINRANGGILQGEKDMYERIVKDCEASPIVWYMWYDKTFNIPYAGQNEIQIDFLLILTKV